MSLLKIIVVDDNEAVRNTVRSLLASPKECTVCGEARDGLEAIEKAKLLRPDLILMDVSMPRMDGLELVHEICNAGAVLYHLAPWSLTMLAQGGTDRRRHLRLDPRRCVPARRTERLRARSGMSPFQA